MSFDRAIFFSAVRMPLFGGTLSQTQVDGMTAILDEWDAVLPGGDPRWLSYSLATIYRECGVAMYPVREWGLGRGRTYGDVDPTTGFAYYGRGYPQLTWKANYAKMGAIIGVDLVHNPDKMLDPHISAQVMIIGMRDGIFTGKKLADYFNADVNDPVDARRIINGLDHAYEVAGTYNHFLAAIDAATPLKSQVTT